MSRELPAYRDNLEDILEFTGGRRLLTLEDVKRYTGLGDNRTVRKRFPYFLDNVISAPTLARCLAGGETKK